LPIKRITNKIIKEGVEKGGTKVEFMLLNRIERLVHMNSKKQLIGRFLKQNGHRFICMRTTYYLSMNTV